MFREMLEALGMKVARETAKELEMRCPFHEDRHPSFYVSKDTGAWICHAGCGAGSFLELEQRLQVMDLDSRPSARAQTSQPKSVDLGLSSLIDRGFSPAMLEHWGIAYNEDVKAIEIPCYHVDNRFIGYIFKNPEGQKPKYLHPEGFPRGEFLFGIQKLLPLEQGKEVFLVEGPLDAIWLQEAGFQAVAVLGTRLTQGQVDILYGLRVHRAILCFDNDGPGKMAAAVALELLRRSGGMWVFRVVLPEQYKDIQEVPFSDVSKVVGDRHLCINGRGLIPAGMERWFAHELGR